MTSKLFTTKRLSRVSGRLHRMKAGPEVPPSPSDSKTQTKWTFGLGVKLPVPIPVEFKVDVSKTTDSEPAVAASKTITDAGLDKKLADAVTDVNKSVDQKLQVLAKSISESKTAARTYLKISRGESTMPITFVEVPIMRHDKTEPTITRVWSFETSDDEPVQAMPLESRGDTMRVNFSYHFIAPESTEDKDNSNAAEGVTPSSNIILDVAFVRVDTTASSYASVQIPITPSGPGFTSTYVDVTLDPGTYIMTFNSKSTVGIIDVWY